MTVFWILTTILPSFIVHSFTFFFWNQWVNEEFWKRWPCFCCFFVFSKTWTEFILSSFLHQSQHFFSLFSHHFCRKMMLHYISFFLIFEIFMKSLKNSDEKEERVQFSNHVDVWWWKEHFCISWMETNIWIILRTQEKNDKK